MKRAVLVQDPLYGRIELPGFLEPFLLSPEFARLSGVRLLNFQSLELAALSEARRRSHTLGVLHLGSRLTLLDFGPDDIKALLLTAVLHDVGTPPFGHTVEYEYILRTGMNHERIVSRLLDGDHNQLGLDHQIYDGRSPRLAALLEDTGLQATIRSILDKSHPLSACLFGDIDLDNIDNVYRMNWYLGERCEPKNAERLAALIDLDRKGQKFLDEVHRPLVQDWLSLRARAYDRLLNSPGHRRNQAVFSRIVFEAMEKKSNSPAIIDEDDWFATDEKLIQILRQTDRLKLYFADLDRTDPLPEISIEFESEEPISRATLTGHRNVLVDELGLLTDRPVYVTLLAIGETLARRVEFIDRRTGKTWSEGSPRLTYRLHVHIGGSSTGGDMASARQAVSLKAREYAYRHGWIGEARAEPTPPERNFLEL